MCLVLKNAVKLTLNEILTWAAWCRMSDYGLQTPSPPLSPRVLLAAKALPRFNRLLFLNVGGDDNMQPCWVR